ncbi:MAG: alpha/beta fold hydrolase [Spirochaetota bacterium]
MNLYYRELGSGEPVIILHGLFGTGDNWMNVARALSQEQRVILPDMPNHGGSPHAPGMDYASQARAVVGFLDELGVDRVSIIGHSMGGKAAMAASLLYPGRIERLAVVDIAPKRYEPSHTQILSAMEKVHEQAPATRSEADRILESGGIAPAAVRAFLLKSYSPGGEGSEGARGGWKLNFGVIRDEYPHILDWPDFGPAQFDGSVAAIYGEDSGYVTADDFSLFASMFPSVTLHPVEGAGHWLHAQRPETVIRLISETLK